MNEIQTDSQTASNDKTVYILDSYGLIYRAYFALFSHPIVNTKNENISAVTIFFKNLRALLSHYRPSYLIAAFDSRTPTFRHEMYSEYKATRQKTPDDLHAQVPWIEEILNSLGVPVLRKDGFEADDIIATVSAECKKQNRGCRVLTGDKDLMQLIDENCLMMKPDKANGGWETINAEGVKTEWGVGPEQMLDLLSLTGDSADNVPGVKGVGDKTAVKLLTQYGTLENIYEHASEIKGALGEKIRGDRENAFFSKKLIKLRYDVPLDFDLENSSTSGLNYFAAGKKLLEYGAVSAARQFGTETKTFYAENFSINNSDNSVKYNIHKSSGSSGASNKSNASAKNDENSLFQGNLFDDSSTSKNTGSSDNSTANGTINGTGTGTDSLPTDSSETQADFVLKKNTGNYTGCTSLIELTAFIDSILSSGDKTAAFDTETDGLNTHSANLVGFSLCCEKGKAIYVPVILPGGMFAPETISKKDSLTQLSRLFYNKDVTVIMHNGKFDLEVLHSNGMDGKIECRLFDTMIAAWLLSPEALGKSPYSLEYLGETKLGLCGIDFNDVVEKGSTFADVPLEKAVPYGAEDADFTYQLWNYFKPKLENHNLNNLFYNMEMKILPILAQMEETGIHLDKNALSVYQAELSDEIQKKQQEIFNEVGHEFNISSTKQLQQVLFEERKLKPGKKTKTGYSTDTAVLEELAQIDSVPEKILEYRSYTKLQSTYAEALPLLADEHSRIHTSFMQTGTATGRLSSREPNLQNIPVRDENGRRIRSAFTAVPGTVLISADYAQIELVVLSHLSADKNMCEAFRNGVDVHKATAALLYGTSEENVDPQMRRTAKTINFGIMYGMSAFSLAKDLKISRTQAQEFIDSYFQTYSGIREFREKTILEAKQTGFTQTIMGRKRYISAINSKNKLEQTAAERIALNTPIQGSAADIVKKAMIDVQQALEETGSRAKMLLQVHDELIFECPDDKETIEKTLSLIKDKMENAVQLSIPLRVSIEYGKSWGEFH